MEPTEEAGDRETVRARIDGRNYLCTVDAESLEILNEQGEELNATAALVLMSLGGAEPDWLTTAEALAAAFQVAEGRPVETVRAAAMTLELNEGRRAEVARSTTDPGVLAALAAVGTTQVGANPACTVRAWDLLMKSRDTSVRRQALRRNEILPPALWQYPDAETKVRVAQNPATPEDVLHTLATLQPEVLAVRRAVCSNVTASASLLALLADDDDMGVRRAVASNPRCPEDCFKSLSRDRYADVRTAIVSNPAMPLKRVARRIWSDPTPGVHVALAARVDLHTRSLTWLERYSRSDPITQYLRVCSRIKDHPNCSARLAERIVQTESHVRSLPPEKFDSLETPRIRAGNLPPGVLATSLLTVAAIAVAAGLMTAGIQQLRHSRTGQGIAMLVAGVVIGVGLLMIARAVYRRSPVRGVISPPRPRVLVVPLAIGVIVAVGVVVVPLVGPAVGSAPFPGTLLLFVVVARLGRRIVAGMKSSHRK